jgi:hypothetical protein
MPIRGFLTHQAFDPEAIRDMSAALEAACKALQLNMRNDPATRLVAEKIIELAQRGVSGEAALLAMTLKAFNAETAE